MFAGLADKRRLDREKAASRLQAFLDSKSYDTQTVEILQDATLDLISQPAWESRHGGLLALKAIIPVVRDENWLSSLLSVLKTCLQDEEQRVRLIASEALEILCARQGTSVYASIQRFLLDSIEANFVREGFGTEGTEADQGYDSDVERADTRARARPESPTLPSPRSSSPLPLSPSSKANKKATSLMIESEGWRSLEGSMKALQHIMQGCGPPFSGFVTDELLNLVYRSSLHSSRFVREIGFQTCASIAQVCDAQTLVGISSDFTPRLAAGLSDNWSAVRFAAAIATRAWVERAQSVGHEASLPKDLVCCCTLSDNPIINAFLPSLIPSLCLNRYYVAEGVRLYSADTWRIAVADRGRDYVAALAPEVMTYYTQQSLAANYFVREAACHCMGELGSKIDRDAVRPLVPSILKTLLECFGDQSWPVRIASGTAASRFALSFPSETKATSAVPQLIAFYIDHMSSNINGVREDAAVAMGVLVKAYGKEVLEVIQPMLLDMIKAVKDQPHEMKSSLEAGKRSRDNDPTLHTGQKMYATEDEVGPAMRIYGSYMEHRLRRPVEPWERTDGCVYLIRELASISPETAVSLLPALGEAASCSHFSQYFKLLQNIWTQVPVVCKTLGSRKFKPYLEYLVPPLFTSLADDNQVVSSTAFSCIQDLQRIIGAQVFRGRLSRQYQEQLDRCLDIGGPIPASPLGALRRSI